MTGLLGRFRVGQRVIVAQGCYTRDAPATGGLVTVAAVLDSGALRLLGQRDHPDGAIIVRDSGGRHWRYGPGQLVAPADLGIPA